MTYRIVIARAAEKELARIDSIWIEKITSAIAALATRPRPHGCKKLVGGRGL